MLIRRVTLLVVMLILSLAASALAAEPSPGMIEGRLINGTAGGSSVANQDVTLTTYLNEAELSSISATTNSEGEFVFEGLSIEPSYSYQVMLVFQQAEYYSEPLSFDGWGTTQSVEVTVYDSTTSDETIGVTMSHTIISLEQDHLKVREYFLFANDADLTYIGSKEVTAEGSKEILKFFLPKGATELQYTFGLMECCIVGSGDGFVETMPVLPGGKEVAYSYNVGYSSGEYTLSQNMNYATTRYDLLVQGDEIEVNVGRLTAEGPMDIEGTMYQHFSGGDFAPGDILVIQLSGLPETNKQGTTIWVALALVVLACGFTFSYLFKKRRVQPVSPEDSLDVMRQRLLIELAHLDDDFEGGKVQEDVYRKLRAERKAQLVELMQRTKGDGGQQ